MSDPEEGKAEFFFILGQVIMVWGHVESSLSRLFASITSMDTTLARRVFYSARSFTGRTDMLKAAVKCPTITLHEDDEILINKFIKVAGQYSAIRNIIAHDIVVHIGFEGHEFSNQWVLIDGKYDRYLGGENAVNIDQLNNFQFNISQYFLLLCAFLDRSTENFEQVRKQCLSLLQKLPNLPLESRLSPSDADLVKAISPTSHHL